MLCKEAADICECMCNGTTATELLKKWMDVCQTIIFMFGDPLPPLKGTSMLDPAHWLH